MLKLRLAVCTALLIFIAGLLQAKPAAWVLTPSGLGPVKIGMSVKQVSKAIAAPVKLVDDASDDPEVCAVVPLPGQEGISLMFEHAHLTSISIGRASRTKTERGIAVGDTEVRVKAAYPSLDITAADYDEAPASNLTYWVKKDVSGIRFKTGQDRKVLLMSAGGRSITYTEGCL